MVFLPILLPFILEKMKEIYRIVSRESTFVKCTSVLQELALVRLFAKIGGDRWQKCGKSAPQLPGGLESSNKKPNRGNQTSSHII